MVELMLVTLLHISWLYSVTKKVHARSQGSLLPVTTERETGRRENLGTSLKKVLHIDSQ